MMAKAKVQSSIRRRRIFDGVWTYTVLVVLAVVWLIPIVWVVCASFRGESSGLISTTFFPKVWTTDNFVKLFTVNRDIIFGKWLLNTAEIAVCNCIGTTFLTLCTAYALSRFRFKMRKGLMNIALVLGMFPGFMSMSAIYIILNMVTVNGSSILLGNQWSLLIIYLAGAGLGFFVTKGYFDTLPTSMDEAARIDGASRARVFFRIILPLAKPIIVYTALMAFMTPWTDYVLAQIILSSDKTKQSWTVAVGLYNLTEQDNIATYFTSFAAGCIVIAVPIVMLYLSLQKFMINGISAGAVKG